MIEHGLRDYSLVAGRGGAFLLAWEDGDGLHVPSHELIGGIT